MTTMANGFPSFSILAQFSVKSNSLTIRKGKIPKAYNPKVPFYTCWVCSFVRRRTKQPNWQHRLYCFPKFGVDKRKFFQKNWFLATPGLQYGRFFRQFGFSQTLTNLSAYRLPISTSLVIFSRALSMNTGSLFQSISS